jgi:hypothetical protein
VSDRPKTRNRLLLYVGISVFTTLGTGITVAMCGDGTITWAMFRFLWMMLSINLVLQSLITARAFIDRTPSEEKEEQKTEAWKKRQQPTTP